MKNIILVGMPGCGKTTIGRLLSKRLGLGFFDCDAELERMQAMSISQIFDAFGEEYFRTLEATLIKEHLPTSDFVISTGGGIVENPQNTNLLKASGTVVFVNRPLELILNDISTSQRPLLRDGKDRLLTLFKRRIDLYKNACHIEIENSSDIDSIVSKITDEVTKNG